MSQPCNCPRDDLDSLVLDAAAKWAMADAIAQDQPYGTGRNVWTKTAERLADDIFRAARARNYQASRVAEHKLPTAGRRQ